MKSIPLSQGKVTLVDDEDYEWLTQWRWYANKGKLTWYAQSTKSPQVLMHHLIVGRPIWGLQVDHRDRNGLNNQRYNLRIVTNAQNTRNKDRLRRNKSGFTGVSWDKKQRKWRATTSIADKPISIGRYDSIEEAVRAYREFCEPLEAK